MTSDLSFQSKWTNQCSTEGRNSLGYFFLCPFLSIRHESRFDEFLRAFHTHKNASVFRSPRAFHLIWINSWTVQKYLPTAPQFIFHTANNAPRVEATPVKRGKKKRVIHQKFLSDFVYQTEKRGSGFEVAVIVKWIAALGVVVLNTGPVNGLSLTQHYYNDLFISLWVFGSLLFISPLTF